MLHHIIQLNKIARKKSRIILGLMSGTSLDGLDVALCKIQGHGLSTNLTLLHFATLPYTNEFRAEVRKIFAQPTIAFAELTVLNVLIAQCHAELIMQCLKQWQVEPEQVDCIASHGQTVYHAPRSLHGRSDWPNATLQIGDGDHIAHKTGILTISDFRQKHVAVGGEGAPLALYGDYFLFSKSGEERFLVNIGGISNFTYLPADGAPHKVFATDTGPGNTLLDGVTQRAFGRAFDTDGQLAGNGVVQDALLQELLKHPYFMDSGYRFAQFKSKSTGPEMFSATWLQSCLDRYPKGQINPYDLLATLACFTAEAIAQGIKAVPLASAIRKVYLSGGGAHNLFLVNALKSRLPDFELCSIADLGISADAKEACLFAVLANETLAGRQYDTMLGGVPLVGMGKLCFPT